jgi:DNA-directed RNA polymerase specialized sigma24 family protein
MSRQDRSDAMWLSENWITIQGKMKELDINSCSASYLRQLLRKEAKSTPTEGGDVSEANETDNDDSSEASSTVESSALELSGNDAESIANAVITLAKLKGVSLAEIATLLLAESAM